MQLAGTLGVLLNTPGHPEITAPINTPGRPEIMVPVNMPGRPEIIVPLNMTGRPEIPVPIKQHGRMRAWRALLVVTGWLCWDSGGALTHFNENAQQLLASQAGLGPSQGVQGCSREAPWRDQGSNMDALGVFNPSSRIYGEVSMTTIATSLTMPYKFTKQSNHHPLHRPTGMQKPRISNMCRMGPGL